MSLVATIPLNRVRIGLEAMLIGFEGFILVWSRDALKVYKEVI